MKKPILIAIVAAAVIACFVTCQKENLSTQAPIVRPKQLTTTCLDYLYLECGDAIPHYASAQDFEDAYDCLEDDYETYNDTYEAQFPTLDDNDYDDQVESDVFNEDQPLDDWETTYGYTSLRTALTAEEDTWLANDMVGSDPFEHAVSDFIFMTLISAEGDVQIGSALYHFDADGSVIVVSNGDCDELADAKASSEYESQYVLRIPVGNEICRNYKKSEDREEYTQDAHREFRWRVDFDSYISRSRAKTVARNFRYKNGSWKRAAAKTYVYIGGDVWNNECLSQSPMSYNDKTKKRKRVLTRRVLSSFCKIKTEEVQGIVEIINDGAYINVTLDWQ